jgi:nitroreductase
MNETIQIIKARRSTRAFLPEQIKEEELQTIIEAGLYAPSASNQQPWHVTVIQNKQLIEWMSNGFKTLAKSSDNDYLKNVGNNENFHVFYNSPTVILLSGDETKSSAAVDCAAVVQNMLIAAEALGIGSCWIGFIAHFLNSAESKTYLKELGIPEGFKQIHGVALGYKKNKAANAPERKQNVINYIR